MSTPEKKRLPPEEAWAALERAAVEDAVDDVLGLDDAQLDAELRAGGLDPSKVRSRGEALGRGMDAKRAASVRRLRLRFAVAAAATVAVLAVVVLVVGSTLRRRGPEAIGPDDAVVPSASTARSQVAVADPKELRERALADCARGDWASCAAELDRARELDPAGENDPRVRKARKQLASDKPK